jgi:hypothetical protein
VISMTPVAFVTRSLGRNEEVVIILNLQYSLRVIKLLFLLPCLLPGTL